MFRNHDCRKIAVRHRPYSGPSCFNLAHESTQDVSWSCLYEGTWPNFLTGARTRNLGCQSKIRKDRRTGRFATECEPYVTESRVRRFAPGRGVAWALGPRSVKMTYSEGAIGGEALGFHQATAVQCKTNSGLKGISLNGGSLRTVAELRNLFTLESFLRKPFYTDPFLQGAAG